jgi:hypothetical protein
MKTAKLPAKAGYFQSKTVCGVWEDWVVAEAVTCEPVSAANSLISGNLLGKFAIFGSFGGVLR